MKILVAPLGNSIRKAENEDGDIRYEVIKYRFSDNEMDF